MFNKEIGKKLVLLRKKVNLTQSEIAKRMRIKSASGRSFIAQLEIGLIKNPSIGTLFNYLSACGASWTEFVKELELSYNKTRRKGIVSQVKLPSNFKLQKKIDRDAQLYAKNISGVPKQSVTINTKLVKEKIKSKVMKLLTSHQTDEKLIPIYLDYTNHMFEREQNPNPNPQLNYTPWIKSGIKKILFSTISSIVHKTYWQEKKKLLKQKPLSQDKQEQMAVRFARYRAHIEPIELAVQGLLNQIVIPEVLYPFYKAYTRECFKAIRKYLGKDPVLLRQKISNINDEWIANGLNSEVLNKINNVVLVTYQNIQ
jgi:transcriptional regulator with XRE-family HTH domain